MASQNGTRVSAEHAVPVQRRSGQDVRFLGVDLAGPIKGISRAVSGGSECERALLLLAACPPAAMPAWKRVFDVVFASAALVLLSPLLLVIALTIRILSPGPVLFKQERIGWGGNSFQCLKFRSMRCGVETDGHRRYLDGLRESDRPMAKLDAQHDARLIPLAHVMRAAALDELPQLINVLRGDMSLVGPRPAIPYEYENYEAWQRLRFCSVPGMTGMWQVGGKNETTFSEMIRLDTRYALTKSLWTDLKIIACTPPVLIKQVTEIVGRRKGK